MRGDIQKNEKISVKASMLLERSTAEYIRIIYEFCKYIIVFHKLINIFAKEAVPEMTPTA